ncbi:MAG: hypothetical protein ACRET4_14940 [Steroidobacteraceae bacterium]
MENRSVPISLPAAAEAALTAGRYIEAIKVLRTTEQLDLTQAKQRLDAYLTQNPDLRVRMERTSREMRGKIIKWVLVLDGIIVLVVLYWFFGRH